ncbi:MAG: rRNA maturation RNase YbeY [Actinobacteria bacterium]|nr:rRNA maturation RNase YbeY [Actinomycetota bacterium]
MTDDPPDTPAVLVSNRQGMPLDEGALVAAARDCLVAEGRAGVELSVSLVEEGEMADLHQRYMGEPGPTDVLSFPLGEEAGAGVVLLGDVVICPPFAEREVAGKGHPHDLDAELRLLVVHGILHLLGYGHDEEGERAEMWARQERYSGVRVP